MRGSSSLATLLLLVPVTVIPLLAIFGIPQFVPSVAQPMDDPLDAELGPAGDTALSSTAGGPRTAAAGEAPAWNAESPDSRDDTRPSAASASDWTEGRERMASRETSPRPAPVRGPVARRGAGQSTMGDPAPWPTHTQPLLQQEAGAEVLSVTDATTTLASFDAPTDHGTSEPFPSETGGTDPQSSGVSPASYEAPFIDDRHRSAAPDLAGNGRGPLRGAAADRDPETTGSLTDGTSDLGGTVQSEPISWQTAVRRLEELQIRNFRLEPGHRVGQFVFTCSYTPADNARLSYRFEAEANEPLRAVEKVLEQIEQWLAQRK